MLFFGREFSGLSNGDKLFIDYFPAPSLSYNIRRLFGGDSFPKNSYFNWDRELLRF